MILVSILLGFWILLIGYINWDYWRERAKMTTEQRKLDDEENRQELQIW